MKNNKTLPWNVYYKEGILAMLSDLTDEVRVIIDKGNPDQRTPLISYIAEVQLLISKVGKGDFAPEHYPDYGCDDDLVDVSEMKEYMSSQEFDLMYRENGIFNMDSPSMTDISYMLRLKYRYKAYMDVRFRLDVLQAVTKL